MVANIHSFETFGTVDGPGIRFVMFLQGCPLRCKYCHNPDTWNLVGGKQYSVEECVAKILKYKNYYGKDGGVTLTGGEPLLQIDFVIELFKELKKLGIHTCVDTSGITFSSDIEVLTKFDELLKVTDLFLLDIKHIDNTAHKELTSKSNDNIKAFARYLSSNNKDMWIRHVLVPGINTSVEYLTATKAFIDELKSVKKIEILPYHKMGISKYEQLNIPYRLQGVEVPTKEEIGLAKKILLGEKND